MSRPDIAKKATVILKENTSNCICICSWQNVLGTHHASAHGGSSDLIVKMLD